MPSPWRPHPAAVVARTIELPSVSLPPCFPTLADLHAGLIDVGRESFLRISPALPVSHAAYHFKPFWRLQWPGRMSAQEQCTLQVLGIALTLVNVKADASRGVRARQLQAEFHLPHFLPNVSPLHGAVIIVARRHQSASTHIFEVSFRGRDVGLDLSLNDLLVNELGRRLGLFDLLFNELLHIYTIARDGMLLEDRQTTHKRKANGHDQKPSTKRIAIC